MRPSRLFVGLFAALLAASTTSVQSGGDLSIDWSTADAGGGPVSGGDFELNGTIGQVDADPLQPASGGIFELTGGFWVIDAALPSALIFGDGFEAP
jgi:hypothetical protein